MVADYRWLTLVYKRTVFVKEYLWWLSTGLHKQLTLYAFETGNNKAIVALVL